MCAILGQSTNAWFRKTKMGNWFYKKVDQCYTWAAKRYDLDVLTKEEKLMQKFPSLVKRIKRLEKMAHPDCSKSDESDK